MPCNKKKPAVIGTKANQAARETWRESNHDLPPEPVTPTERSSPDPPLPKVSYNTIRNELLDRTSRRGTIEASLIPLPDDQENDSPRTIRFYPKQNFEDDWRKMGYYTEHPNNNPAAVNEAQLKKMMEKHHRLGKVVEKYRLFINKPSGKRTMLLQYPNREIGQEYRASTGQKPLEIRIKPKCGLVEVDIPIHLHYNYDKVKGIEYGEAMRKSRLMQQGGSYSLGGGLGIGPKPTSKDDHRAPLPEGPSQEKLLENIDDANNKGHVMNKITLGGQIFPPKDGDPIYMIATFQGNVCTWTKLDAMVQLRPQFGHIDALNEANKTMFRSERSAVERGEENPEEGEAKAVNMAVKSTENNDDQNMYGGMNATSKLLRAMRDEPWQRLKWIDQDDPESYEVYNDALVYKDPDNAPQLVSEMTNEQYLDAISCPRIDPIKQGEKVMPKSEELFAESETESKQDEESNAETVGEVKDDEDDGEWETLPVGAIRPPEFRRERLLEQICRAICCKPEKEQDMRERRFKQLAVSNPKWATCSFLFPSDRSYIYYKWRLAENRAGRGIPVEYD